MKWLLDPLLQLYYDRERHGGLRLIEPGRGQVEGSESDAGDGGGARSGPDTLRGAARILSEELPLRSALSRAGRGAERPARSGCCGAGPQNGPGCHACVLA
ncbi:macrophage immunometabolism regulator isoform X3 [Taeniopygia guttata]|uniref:macrophage immunometabolism regulator isoform X3 n=1 Tax=Taeniopygia guttata TaxID=59729 RepID=UPI003BB88497